MKVISLFDSKNNRAELLSIWWFFVLVIIGVGVVAGTFMFAADKIDARITQSEVISNKILGCISDTGVFDARVLEEDFDIFSYCQINKIIFQDSGKYVLKISVNKKIGDDWVSLRSDILGGNNGLIANCMLGNNLVAEEYPRCSEKTILLLDSQQDVIQLKILVGSNYEYGV